MWVGRSVWAPKNMMDGIYQIYMIGEVEGTKMSRISYPTYHAYPANHVFCPEQRTSFYALSSLKRRSISRRKSPWSREVLNDELEFRFANSRTTADHFFC